MTDWVLMIIVVALWDIARTLVTAVVTAKMIRRDRERRHGRDMVEADEEKN